MLDIFVVAGSYREFQNLLGVAAQPWEKEIKRRQVHYVHHVSELHGIRGARVFMYGTYFKRKDLPAIEAQIVIGGNRRLLIR